MESFPSVPRSVRPSVCVCMCVSMRLLPSCRTVTHEDIGGHLGTLSNEIGDGVR